MLQPMHRNRCNSGRVQILLSAALQNGGRIASASAEEQSCSTRPGSGAAGCSDERRMARKSMTQGQQLGSVCSRGQGLGRARLTRVQTVAFRGGAATQVFLAEQALDTGRCLD